jgi:predicted PurR-regulated permease PerM
MVNGVITSAMGVVSVVVFLLVVPVVTFYMLLDWDRMVAGSTGFCRAIMRR